MKGTELWLDTNVVDVDASLVRMNWRFIGQELDVHTVAMK